MLIINIQGIWDVFLLHKATLMMKRVREKMKDTLFNLESHKSEQKQFKWFHWMKRRKRNYFVKVEEKLQS